LVVRAFAAPIGIDEDPVTGSLNGSLAQWLIGTGRMPPAYRASQGRAMGRDGVVTIDADASGTVRVGGASVTCVSGTVLC
jgi:PhzF family phenazine biosynthesis protein